MEQPKQNIKLVSNKNSRVILPNILTLFGVCIGLSSIKFAFDGNFELAVIALIVAGIIDGLDGRIARLIKGTSKVGKELDSLTDVISFGVAPAFIMYFWSLVEIGRLGWLVALIYVVCVALRLASKIPTYALKKIVVPRNTTIFLLFSVILFFGLLFIYTFNTIVVAGTIYLLSIPVSAFHFYSILKNKKSEEAEETEHHEDVL